MTIGPAPMCMSCERRSKEDLTCLRRTLAHKLADWRTAARQQPAQSSVRVDDPELIRARGGDLRTELREE